MSAELVIDQLRASVGGVDVLRGVDLVVRSGEVHAVMGPNGSGKSTLAHVLLGRPGYTVTGGAVTLDGVDLLALPPHERTQAGLFGALQYPVEVPGVALTEVLAAALSAAGRSTDGLRDTVESEARRIGLDVALLDRALNVDLSGGEKKRNETVQLAALQPSFAVLDEIDSGLDVDALEAVSRRIEEATNEFGLGVLAITHYNRLLTLLRADQVHVFARGRILETGGPELATQLEDSGYASYDEPDDDVSTIPDPMADPFADPLA